MTDHITESGLDEATLSWFGHLGYAVAHGDDIAPEGPHTERESFGDVLPLERLRDTLLPKLLSGKIRVGDSDKIVDASI